MEQPRRIGSDGKLLSITALTPTFLSARFQDLKDYMRRAGDVVFSDVNSSTGEGVVEFSNRWAKPSDRRITHLIHLYHVIKCGRPYEYPDLTCAPSFDVAARHDITWPTPHLTIDISDTPGTTWRTLSASSTTQSSRTTTTARTLGWRAPREAEGEW